MKRPICKQVVYAAAVLTGWGVLAYAQVQPPAQNEYPLAIPNMGQQINPFAPTGAQFVWLNPGMASRPDWYAGQAATAVVSPDNQTLLVLTTGYNRVYTLGVPSGAYPWNAAESNEYVFIYDISKQTPNLLQVIQIPNTYFGIVFDPASYAANAPAGTNKRFYVAGGENDDVHTISLTNGQWAEESPSAPALAMHHGLGVGLNIQPSGAIQINSQVGVYPCAAGLAMSSDGKTLVVVDYYNEAITVFTGGYGNWSKPVDLDLRPGKSAVNPQSGKPGGEYPFWVAVKGTGASAVAYVSSIRDREIDVVSLGSPMSVMDRIHVKGQPNKMTLDAAQAFLYVAEDQADIVDVIDTGSNTIKESIPVVAPLQPDSLQQYRGANPNSVALSPDGTQLLVTDGNLNCVSVIALGGSQTGDHVVGLIPTGWYPNSVSIVSTGGSTAPYVYVANEKSPTGANPQWCYGGYGPPNSPNCNPSNEYNPQLTRAGLQSFALPTTQLASLTQLVLTYDNFSYQETASDAAVMSAVRAGIKHVVFIIKENRTYDQVLGDLPNDSNGDPALTEFGEAITPNLHALAQQFVTLDNIMATAEVSYDGWHWTTAGQAPDVVEHQYPVAYAYRGTSLDSEGVMRNVNVGIPPVSTGTPAGDVAARQKANPFTSSDPDDLPGQADVDAPDGPGNEINTGFLWDAAMRAGLTVRSYGFFVDTTRYSTPDFTIPVLRNPYASGTQVAFPTNVALNPVTDPYFRGFDNSLPDYWRYQEWARDFDARYKDNHHAGRTVADLPALTLIRLMHDHTGNYSTAIDGVNTPDLEIADNDYAVGLVVQKISQSPFAGSTLVFVIEDDAQDGADHVDSHRTIAFVVGPYVKQGAVVSTRYSTLNFLRTIEEVLGIPEINAQKGLQPMMNLNDALARPMADIFNTTPGTWSYTAAPSALLYNSSLPLPPQPAGMLVPRPSHDAAYWARVTKGMNFSDADLLDGGAFNRILWKGLMGDKPYPAKPTGMDLRQNRAALLAPAPEQKQ
ncbi:MAG TPA: bifunctional YncE family protein/alkaline phosphatase family protein [Bryobacteraceae bacterium]|nr:bifunctional YncE family protein/alkaline phosphatase family protein [Bryobacteraceae bacterium]